MKRFQFTLAAVVLVLSGCSKSEDVSSPTIESGIYSINATSGNAGSRTELGGENGLDILWQEGDAMNLYVKDITNTAGTYAIVGGNDLTPGTMLSTSDSGETSAEFVTGDGSAIPTIEPVTGEVTYFALTPYIDNKVGGTYSGGSEIKLQAVGTTKYVAIYFLMPATQTYVAGSYDPAVAFAYAKTNDISNGLSFNNLFGVLRLNLIGTADQYVKSITVTAGTTNLSGFVNAYTAEDMANNTSFKLSAGGNGSGKVITMDCTSENEGKGVALSETATPFNIALLPVNTDLTVVITYDENGEEKILTKVTNSAITRSVLTNMPELDLTPEDQGGNTDGGDKTESLTPGDGEWVEE